MTRTPRSANSSSRRRSFSIGVAFWKLRMMPTRPSSLAAWMSATERTGRICAERTRKRSYQAATASAVSTNPSHVATVALVAVRPPA